jgi:paraquat-inducible protein A
MKSVWVACRDCAAIQQLPPPPGRGRLECCNCGRPLERTTGRSLDRALACSLATFLLLVPANFWNMMTVYIAGEPHSSPLFGGAIEFWQQGWPMAAMSLTLFGIILPFVHFGVLSVTLTAIRFGVRGTWVGTAFRYSQILDIWAMSDVVLIGAGIGYGRLASQTRVDIDPGGWCLVVAAAMTMLTRASLERRAVWRRLEMPPAEVPTGALACTSCDLVLPPEYEGKRCPRCTAVVHRREPFSVLRCAALTAATWFLMPIAYGYPMSQFWKAGIPESHTVIDGIRLLFEHGFWYFGIVIFFVSVIFPFTKVVSLTWFMLGVRRGWTKRLRFKTDLYRFVDEVGRWSVLDPFTVMVFLPMIQLGQLGHFQAKGGCEAFLATVILSMIATRLFDPRLMWDAASSGRTLRVEPKVARGRRTAAPHRGSQVPAQAG